MCVVVEVGLRYMSVGRNVADDKQRGVFFQEDKSNSTDSGGPLKKRNGYLSFFSIFLSLFSCVLLAQSRGQNRGLGKRAASTGIECVLARGRHQRPRGVA